MVECTYIRQGDFQSKSIARHKEGHYIMIDKSIHRVYNHCRGFPGGSVVKDPPANEGDIGSIPGPGRSHLPWSN